MIFTRPPAYVCYQFWTVCVRYVRVHQHVSPIAAAMHGITEGQEEEMLYEAAWHSERFTRDDIDHDQVQKGYRSHQVKAVMRTFLPATARLFTWNDKIRVESHKGPDGFFVGYARSLTEAASWVATGHGRLLVPWEGL